MHKPLAQNLMKVTLEKLLTKAYFLGPPPPPAPLVPPPMSLFYIADTFFFTGDCRMFVQAKSVQLSLFGISSGLK